MKLYIDGEEITECTDFKATIIQNKREYEGALNYLRNEEQKKKDNINLTRAGRKDRYQAKIYKLNKMLNEKVLNTLEVLKNDRNRKGSR